MSKVPHAQPSNPEQHHVPQNNAYIPGNISVFLGIMGLVPAFVLLGSLFYPDTFDIADKTFRTQLEEHGSKVFAGGLLYLVSSAIAIIGGIAMIRGRGYRKAYAAAIYSSIPFLSPCLLLGIPFGIWGIVALNKPATQAYFTRKDEFRTKLNYAVAPGGILLSLGITWLINLLVLSVVCALTFTSNPRDPAQFESESNLASASVFLAAGLVNFLSGVIAIAGGIAMLQGRRLRRSTFAATCACIPLLSPGLVLGIPFGIWALVALRQPATQRVFEENEFKSDDK